MIRKKTVGVTALLICGCLLAACGDDVTVSVPPVGEAMTEGESGETVTDSLAETPKESQGATSTEPSKESQDLTPTEIPKEVQESMSTENSGEFSSPAPTEEPGAIQITISAAGDVTLGNYIGQGYTNSFDYTYEQGVGDAYFFENVADIFSQDHMTLVNLEGPLTSSEEHREGQTFTISGDPGYVNILTEGNVEAVSMANNHRLDYNEQGSDDTVAALAGADITYAYDDVLGMYEVEGIQIGIVSVNEVNDGWLVEAYLKDGIANLKENGADLVIACCHWGVEKENYPEDYQKSLGKKCVEWGADLVIGHHPHVLQGVEEYKGKYIVYSLGNFCFGANRNPSDKDCMIFQQTFTFRDSELTDEKEIRVIPCSISSTPKRNDYKPTPAEGEEAQRIIGRINEYSQEFGLEFDSDGYPVK